MLTDNFNSTNKAVLSPHLSLSLPSGHFPRDMFNGNNEILI